MEFKFITYSNWVNEAIKHLKGIDIEALTKKLEKKYLGKYYISQYYTDPRFNGIIKKIIRIETTTNGFLIISSNPRKKQFNESGHSISYTQAIEAKKGLSCSGFDKEVYPVKDKLGRTYYKDKK